MKVTARDKDGKTGSGVSKKSLRDDRKLDVWLENKNKHFERLFNQIRRFRLHNQRDGLNLRYGDG